MLLLLLACVADPDTALLDSEADPTAHWVAGDGPPATVWGQAFLFGPAFDLSLEGAIITAVEAPEYTTTVAADGSFSLEVPSGRPLSFLLEQEGFTPVQSAAVHVGEEGVAQLGFQVPTEGTTELMALGADAELDPERCQIATTVSSEASPPYGGSGVGEPGATVTLDPGEGAEGPVYFDFISDSFILPDPELSETTIDGGVLFLNAWPGEYTLRASHPTVTFTEAVIRCRAGVVVNAAPPHGLEFAG